MNEETVKTELEKTKAWEERMKETYENLKHPRLRILVETFYDFQKLRIATASRLSLYDRFDMLTTDQYTELSERVGGLTQSESRIKKLIEKEIKDIPVWNEYLTNIKGIGPVMAGDLIGWIDDIGKFNTISKLWAFSVGKPGERRERGKKIGYNPHVKTLMWKVGKQLLMSNNELYRGIYEVAKKKYQERDDIKKSHEGKKGYKQHIHLMAMRKMEKMFLSHLWVAWREIEGLPTSKPYVIEKMGHTTYIEPPEEA
jgi:hypothetical protein